ncbi:MULTISPECIES: hypothetical protein [Paraburkholderia]|uniref:Lipoprotein n=1 Tax=Paraburkholderia phenazinium TaxID=60549 RepID=A0A1N6L0K7_9BURK|nr:hypothetical protein [Paraburkholderia phenazinium]SIO62319.1 hypothetical protein SAMN05444165_5501 [Paraburkholderia phenazinium]
MKRLNILLGVAAAVMVCASGVAHAAHVGVYIGGGGYYYPWGPAYYPYPPAVAVPVPVPAEPQEYVEQGQYGAAPAQAAPGQQSGTWYYCDDSKTYYPYVKSCSSGWRPVPAQQSQGPAN